METREPQEQKPSWRQADLKHFEKRLLDERKRALAQVATFDETIGASQEEADGSLTNWPFHMADQGTDTFEQEQNFVFAGREGQLVRLIDEGLRRLYRAPESFGKCANCGKAIGYERLDAIPYATHCVDCKQDWEGKRAE
jgi:RNA polymerase-binding transcription factor DksA